ncbi:15198_t:CDS:2 [Acaulospora colombiana]|uniref:15198_t:CDS:1 n=1 Tax=Acaulospora colombiana TaxID=27376 RepID=A0ACA9LIP4_9GLOM|nr:15198_t:CDS:2 [Acaulospora colombiana]
MMMKLILTIALFVSITFATPYSFSGHRNKIAPLFSPGDKNVVPGQYIVVFKEHVASTTIDDHIFHVNNLIVKGASTQENHGIRRRFNIEKLKGYSGRFSYDILNIIRHLDEVEYVEQDQYVFASETQEYAPWGISRISHRYNWEEGHKDTYHYEYDSGEGVNVYVIDTGVRIDHIEFDGRASWGGSFSESDPTELDGDGHGTHVAGIIAGRHVGVAKDAKIVAVKVLDSNGMGTWSDVILGIDYVVTRHNEQVEELKSNFTGSVINMSLGGGYSPAVNFATTEAYRAGICVVVAAGNERTDACGSSPASAEGAITVGASTVDDYFAWFSNYGPCVDVFAPVRTSMASPHVAGLSAYFLSSYPGSSPKFIKELIVGWATLDVLKDIPKSSANLLAYNHICHHKDECSESDDESKFRNQQYLNKFM